MKPSPLLYQQFTGADPEKTLKALESARQRGTAMHDIHELARQTMLEYRYQPGLIGIEIEGEPANRIRYIFEDESTASRFMFLRGLLRQHDPGTGMLHLEGSDVVENWVW